MAASAQRPGPRVDDVERSSSGATLAIRLFGGPALQIGERTLPPLTSGRSTALLAHLALHRDGPVPRQRLSFLLWPDSTEAQARTNLRKALHVLRHELPDLERYLSVTSRSIHWREDADCWVDVEAFEQHLRSVDLDGADSDARVAALQAAVDLHRGELLPDLYDDWAIAERERLRGRYHDALTRLARLRSERGEHARAVSAASALARGDPLQEAAHRLLMQVHDAAGDRAAAVRAYHECVSTLRRELGVEPTPETTALYDRLVRRTEPPVEPGPGPRAAHAPLIGREREWQQLTELWLQTEAGAAHLVVVAGEPGVGKTRLVEELASWCSQRGARVLAARSYASGSELGYGVASSWLRTLHRDGDLDRLPGPSRAVLGRLVPELTTDPPADPFDPAAERRLQLEAISEALTSSGRALLLVVDDAQWTDTHSVAAMHHLVRLEPPRRVLVAMTLARHDVSDEQPLREVIADLHRIDRATELTVPRLSLASTDTLARALGVTGDTSGLYTDTEGIPLFVVETARAALDGAPAQGLTPKLRAVIEARLHRCSPIASTVAGVAATVGRSFTTALVRDATRLGVDEAVVAFDELWRRGIIAEHGDDAYDFTHGKLRDVAYDTLSPPERQHNHRALADALQRRHEGGVIEVSDQIAGHYERAGLLADAVEWYQQAATDAARRYRSVDTVRFLERARRLLESVSGADRRQELAVVAALPTALVGVDGFASDRVDAAQRRVVELSTELEVDIDPTVLRSMVMSRLCRRDFGGAQDAAEQLAASARRSGDDGLVTESEYLLGITAFWTGQLEGALSYFDAAISGFASARRRQHIARFGHDPAIVCQSRLANTLGLLGRVDEAEQARDRALRRADEAGHPYSRAAACSFAAMLSIDLERPDEVNSYVERLDQDRYHTRPTASFLEVLRGFVEVNDGQVMQGLARIAAVIDGLADVDQAPGHHACFDRVRVAAHWSAGDPEGALVACDQALARTGSRLWEPEIRRVRAELLAATGATSETVDRELRAAARIDVTRRRVSTRS
ncbi:MAG TPA: BTAD domain-containing putative transcriptional regulator [Acidimicrobiales bacterium]|nr:BTAD domain-containing putative transcriptional regulator [Acidimicrobiales bacterium]